MDKCRDTLFYPFQSGALEPPGEGHSVLFLNAAPSDGLGSLAGAGKTAFQQHFRPYARALQDDGYAVSAALPEKNGAYDYVLIHAPKNRLETQYLIASGVSLLKPGGMILCSAANDAGGMRLKKMLQEPGLQDVQEDSKNKARVAWARKGESTHEALLSEWTEQGGMQSVPGHDFVSMPGIFGWDKIDRGSEILTEYLPENLSGAGADFGCGYGYLSHVLLRHHPDIQTLTCIDADERALRACRENVSKTGHAAQLRYFWEDLTIAPLNARDLDWIVMNPPFHEGRKADSDIGVSFIQSAHESLRPGGALWMVANAGLPYEKTLEEIFSSCSKKYEGSGYKVFCAAK